METLFQDVRYGLRMLVKKPTFTVVAVLTLALQLSGKAPLYFGCLSWFSFGFWKITQRFVEIHNNRSS